MSGGVQDRDPHSDGVKGCHVIACDHETSGGLACSNTFVLHGLMGHALKGAAIVLARHEGWWIEDSGDLCPDHAWETVDHAEYCPICIHAACQVQEKA